MRKISLNEETQLFNIDILDATTNLLICIYKIKDQFAYRYLSCEQSKGHMYDPITLSKKFDWANGPYSSPQQARREAKKYYLEFLTNSVIKI